MGESYSTQKVKTPLLIFFQTYIYKIIALFITKIMNKLTTLLSKASFEKIEKYITIFIYYILPTIVVITLISATTTKSNIGFSQQEFRGSRWRKLLTIVLFIKPITFLWKKYMKTEKISIEYFISTLKKLPKTIKDNSKEINSNSIPKYVLPFLRDCIYSISLYLMKFRRQLGIATFWLLFTHWILWQIFRTRQWFSFWFNIWDTAILSGIVALLALAIGAITSNNYTMQKLQKNWKKIQMIVYIAFFFASIHTGNTFLLIIYFVAKYFERRDTGQLKIWKERWIKQREKIITNPYIIKFKKSIKNNNKISEIRAKICKK